MSDELELKKWWWPRVEEDICAGKTFGPGSWLEPGPKGACQGTHSCRGTCRPFGPGSSYEPGPKVPDAPADGTGTNGGIGRGCLMCRDKR